jgi:2-hydroxy-6-oxonona-2,4-dienedioate hydrolase
MSGRGETLESTWAVVNGLKVHARVSVRRAPKEAPAIVLVHGLGVSSRYMVPTALELASSYRVYAPDLPGSGKSDRPPHVLDIPELADALMAWMDATGLVSATLVGNSLGCQTIVDFSLRYSKRIERAVLVGPTLDPRARTLWQQIERGSLDLLREPLSYWPLLVKDYLVAGPYRTLRTLAYAVCDPLQEKLSRMRVPTLLVRGARDPIAPQLWVEEMKRLIPESRLVVIPEAAHVANYSAPQALAQAIRSFLSSIAVQTNADRLNQSVL